MKQPPRRKSDPRPKSTLIQVEVAQDRDLDAMAANAQFGSCEYHKPNRTGWRADKTKCPESIDEEMAQNLLEQGLSRGMFSAQHRLDWPQHVWAVHEGVIYEANLENKEMGTYHGYPMIRHDSFAEYLSQQWENRA